MPSFYWPHDMTISDNLLVIAYQPGIENKMFILTPVLMAIFNIT